MDSSNLLHLNSLPPEPLVDLNETQCSELEGQNESSNFEHYGYGDVEGATSNTFENSGTLYDQEAASADFPVVIRSSSNGVLVIDLTIGPNQEDSQSVEINIDELDGYNEEHFSPNPPVEDVNIPGGECQQNKRRFLSNEERRAIYEALLQRSVHGKLKRYTTKEVSSLFSVPYKTVQRIWKRSKDTSNGSFVDVSHKKSRNCGRKRVTIDPDSITSIPLNRRTTLRALAEALGISLTTLYARFKEGFLRRHSNAIKPFLKEENKLARLRWCISMLDTSTQNQEPRFKGMFNFVHIDEKWFYMTKKSTTYYLLPNEEEPMRSCQSKNFIGKVMFLSAIARPRFDEEGTEVFSGKIGLFPFATKQPAIRRSRNREAGTLETKPITSVTKEIIRAFLIEKVIPAIQAKWPQEEVGRTLFIQQDNARTHVQPSDEEFQRAASQNGFDIQLVCQLANSPDLNVLDLGFFNAIQSLQNKECAKSVDELIVAVQRAFEEYPTEKINRVFLSLQLCMREIMIAKGGNGYKIPHISKERLERNGHLPSQITLDSVLVENTKRLIEHGILN